MTKCRWAFKNGDRFRLAQMIAKKNTASAKLIHIATHLTERKIHICIPFTVHFVVFSFKAYKCFKTMNSF